MQINQLFKIRTVTTAVRLEPYTGASLKRREQT